MTFPFIIAGLSLGVLSSFHCIGMCGPLIMALPVNHLPGSQKKAAFLLYHTGRVVTYMLTGFLFAILGRGLYIAGFQQYFSIILGSIMLLTALYYFLFKNAGQPLFIRKLYPPVHKLMSLALNAGRLPGFLFLGIVNGLLPCGMVYLAIAGALSARQVIDGVLFMGAFGLGTLPALVLLSVFSYHFSLAVRNTIKKMVPLVVILMGIILILRGLNLGIPYISPQLPHASGEAVICH